MTLHIVKNVVDLPPNIALELIKRGIAEPLDEAETMRERMVKKGNAVGADDNR